MLYQEDESFRRASVMMPVVVVVVVVSCIYFVHARLLSLAKFCFAVVYFTW